MSGVINGKTLRKIQSVLMALVLLVSIVPLSSKTVYAESATEDTTATVSGYTIKVPKGVEIPDSSTTVTELTSTFLETKYVESDYEYKLDEGWYVVSNDASNNPLNVSHQITFNGNANIILKDGSKITVEGNETDSNKYGIRVTSSYNLTIWGGVEETGQLVVKGGMNQEYSYGIFVVGGNLIQNGGIITATGGTATSDDSVGINIGTGCITQNRGEIFAFGGISESENSYGIYAEDSDLIQNNGKITANSNNSYNESCGIYVDNGNLKQYKGEISATSAVSTHDSSYGIYIEDGDLIQYDGSIEATAKKAEEGTSCGVYIGDENLQQNNGTIIAKGDEGQSSGGIYVDNDFTHNGGQIEAYGAESTETWGIFIANCFMQSGGNVKAIGGEAPSNTEDTFSYGIYVYEDLTMIGGSVLASGGAAENSYGIQIDDGFDVSGNTSSLSAEGKSKAIYCNNTLIVSDGFTVKAGTASPGSVVTKSNSETWKDKLCPSSDAPKYVSISPSKSTPTASDFTYNSTTGVITAATDKDLGTVTTYYKVDGSWTTTKPVAAGTYEVGVVSTGSSTYEAIGTASSPFTNATWKYTVISSQNVDDGQVKVPADKQDGNFAAGGLKNSVEEVKTAVLTESDKAAMEAGKDVSVWVEIEEQTLTVSSADKTIVEQKLPTDYKIGTYLDVSLWKQVTGSEATKVTETPNGKVKIGFTIPKNLQKTGRIYKIIRIHNGLATVLDTTVDANFGITFETDQFSTYSLVYLDEVIVTPPKTGDIDSNYYWILIMIAGVAIIGITMVYRKKRQ